MGDIIAFSAGAGRARRGRAQFEGEAQILFFLGVRYVRVEEAAQPTAAAPGKSGDEGAGGRKRKRRARA